MGPQKRSNQPENSFDHGAALPGPYFGGRAEAGDGPAPSGDLSSRVFLPFEGTMENGSGASKGTCSPPCPHESLAFSALTTVAPFCTPGPRRRQNWHLGVHKRDHDVAGAAGCGQSFVVVSEASRVHQAPALAGRLHSAVVADKPAAAALQEEMYISVS